jgi:hypothetical protein
MAQSANREAGYTHIGFSREEISRRDVGAALSWVAEPATGLAKLDGSLGTRISVLRRISVQPSFADVLSPHLKPRCSRDNHIMKYQARPSGSNAKNSSSYYCGFVGCSVRYHSSDGYYMLIGMPDHANSVDEPGLNTLKCPEHERWLYRLQSVDAQGSVRWCCGVEGCDYGYDARSKAVENALAKDFSVTTSEPPLTGGKELKSICI